MSLQSQIEDLISSELNHGAQVTVTNIDSEQVFVTICGTTKRDMDNLLEAFKDGTFHGTVLDGAQVDGIKSDVECDNVDSFSYNNPATNQYTVSNNNPSSASFLVASLLSLMFLFVL